MQISLVSGACVLTAAAGFAVGRLYPPNGTGDLPQTSTLGASSSQRAGSGDGRAGMDGGPRNARPGQPRGSFDAMAKDALSHTLLNKRLMHWTRVLAMMRAEDAPALHAMLKAEQAAGRDVGSEMKSFWETWCELDRSAAWAFAQQQGSSKDAESLLKAWAMLDPAGAERAFVELRDPALAAGAMEGILHGLAESDPTLVPAFVSSLGEEHQTMAAVHVTGSMINRLGNIDAQGWFDEQLGRVSDSFHQESARVLLESLSRSDPALVEKFSMERMNQPWASNPDEQQFTAMMILRGGGSPWNYIGTALERLPQENPLLLPRYSAARQPAEAMQWIESHPDHPSIDQIRGGTVLALLDRGQVEQAQALRLQIRDREVIGRIGAGAAR